MTTRKSASKSFGRRDVWPLKEAFAHEVNLAHEPAKRKKLARPTILTSPSSAARLASREKNGQQRKSDPFLMKRTGGCHAVVDMPADAAKCEVGSPTCRPSRDLETGGGLSLPMMQRTRKSVADIARAKDRRGLQEAILSFVKSLGFDGFDLTYETRSDRNSTVKVESIGDLAANFLDEAQSSPFLEYASTSNDRLCWKPIYWHEIGYQEYYKFLKSYGVHSGTTIPLHGDSDALGALTLLSWTESSLDKCDFNAAAIVGLVARARAEAIAQMCGRTPAETEKYHSLNPLQQEILKWIANGKTNAEIALIVDRTKRTVDYHIIQILQKLEVSSRSQAAAIFAAS